MGFLQLLPSQSQLLPVTHRRSLPPLAQLFECLQAGLPSPTAQHFSPSTTFSHSPFLTGWSTYSAPGCTWVSSIRGWRPGGDPFHVPLGPVNLLVLKALTRGPQGQPSPLRRPHGRPGVQGIFPTSHAQATHAWPMVHHSMVTGFPIPRGCCSVFSASPLSLVRSPATSLSPVPRHVSHDGPFPAPRAFPFSWGCWPQPHALLCPVPFFHHPVFIPKRAASNPFARAH